MTEKEPTSAARPRLGLLRDRDFLKAVDGADRQPPGSELTILALPLTAILLFHASALHVGTLSTVEFLPFVLLGLPVGVWVDRIPRRPILVTADVGRFLVIGSVPLAYALGVLHIGQLYVVAFLSGVFTVLFDVAYGSYLPSLVPRASLVEGNAKLEISRSGRPARGPRPRRRPWSRRSGRRSPSWGTPSAMPRPWVRSC